MHEPTPPPSPRWGVWVGFWGVLAAFVPALVHGASGHDDSHITYWSAWSLRTTGRVVNVNGEAVEQSSALATTVLLALGDLLFPFVGLPNLGTLLSLAGGAATVVLAAVAARRIQPGAGWLAAPLVATEPVLAYWSASGMETSLAAATWVAWPMAVAAFVALPDRRHGVMLAAVSLLGAAVRPEGPFVLAAGLGVAGAWALHQRWVSGTWSAARSLGGPVGLAVAPVAGVFGYRLAAFGAPFPQPVLAKAGGTPDLAAGWDYLVEMASWTEPMSVLSVLAVLTLGLRALRREAVRLDHAMLAGMVVAGGAFVVRSGGDWMEAGRFLVPWIGAAGVVAAVALTSLPPRLRGALVVGVVGVQSWTWTEIAREVSAGRTAWDTLSVAEQLAGIPGDWSLSEYGNAAHARDIVLTDAMEPLLEGIRARKGPGERIVILSGQAGMVPYVLFRRHDDLYFVDTNSLSTRRVNPCLPAKAQRVRRIGLHFNLDDVVRHADRVASECGVPLPDLVYDSGPRPSRILRGMPYTLVRHFAGRSVRTGWLGNENAAGGWIAVRDDHAEALGLETPRGREPLFPADR